MAERHHFLTKANVQWQIHGFTLALTVTYTTELEEMISCRSKSDYVSLSTAVVILYLSMVNLSESH